MLLFLIQRISLKRLYTGCYLAIQRQLAPIALTSHILNTVCASLLYLLRQMSADVYHMEGQLAKLKGQLDSSQDSASPT